MTTPQSYQIDIMKHFLEVDKYLKSCIIDNTAELDIKKVKKWVNSPSIKTTSEDGIFIHRVSFDYEDTFDEKSYKVNVEYVAKGTTSLPYVYITCQKAKLNREQLKVVVENDMPIVKSKNDLVHINYRVFWLIQELLINHWTELGVQNKI